LTTSTVTRRALLVLLLATPAARPSAGEPIPRESPDAVKERPSVQTHVPFVLNLGQANDAVRFYTRTSAGDVLITRSGEIVYGSLCTGDDGTVSADVATERFVGARTARVEGSALAPTVAGSLVGRDPDRWRTAIPCYEAVDLGAVYPGLGVEVGWRGSRLERRFVLDARVDPGTIQVGVEGAGVRITPAGQLEIGRPAAGLRYDPPSAFQDVAGERRRIEVEYRLTDDGWGFDLGPYRADRPLVITHALAGPPLGGAASPSALSVARDGTGSVFVVGTSTSSGVEATLEGREPSGEDAFVARFDRGLGVPAALVLVGGRGDDRAHSLTVTRAGDVYVAGWTGSRDFPVTAGAYDQTHNGGTRDVFVLKLNRDLSVLAASTLLGGSEDEAIETSCALASDAGGHVFVAGRTRSPDFPTTAGAYDPTYDFWGDAFACRFDRNLSTLSASTFLGEWGEESSGGVGVDSRGRVYVVCGTQSSGLETSPDAFDSSFNGGKDVFLARLNNDLSILTAATFLGGREDDVCESIAVDAWGNLYLTGRTNSTDFPTTPGAFDRTLNGRDDVFLCKMGGNLRRLPASTLLGGRGFELGAAVTVDGLGSVYVAGHTSSVDFPTTGGAFDEAYNGGRRDAFVAHFARDLGRLLASTFLGSGGSEFGCAVDLDGFGNVYVVGPSSWPGIPNGSSGGAFVARFNDRLSSAAVPVGEIEAVAASRPEGRPRDPENPPSLLPGPRSVGAPRTIPTGP